jgi:hypothetical protein
VHFNVVFGDKHGSESLHVLLVGSAILDELGSILRRHFRTLAYEIFLPHDKVLITHFLHVEGTKARAKT